MEFLPYAQVRRALDEIGVSERIENDRLRLMLREGGAGQPILPARLTIGEARSGRHLDSPPDRFGMLVERLLHRAHVTDFAVLPAGRWRPILDAIAFDLASSSDWLAIDADAALHQNTREPLVMNSRHRSLLRSILESIGRAGMDPGTKPGEAGAELDLIIVSLGAPLIIETRGPGSIEVQCPECIADTLMQHLATA